MGLLASMIETYLSVFRKAYTYICSDLSEHEYDGDICLMAVRILQVVLSFFFAYLSYAIGLISAH